MIDNIFDEAFLAQLEQLHMGFSFKVHEGMQGGRRSLAKGNSLEFSDFREYEPGDDFRRIDWTAYGRLEKLYIKEYMEEKEAIFHLYIDQSRSMSFGNPSKGETSLKLAAAISYIVMKHQDRVKLRLLGDERQPMDEITSHATRQGFYQFLQTLSQISFEGNGNLCHQLCKLPISGRGVSIIFSDFLFEEGLKAVEQAVAYLRYKKEQVILVQILCKEERSPELLGDFELIDSETAKPLRITFSPKILSAYQKRLLQYEHDLEKIAQKYEAAFVSVASEASLSEMLLKDFYEKKIIF